MRLIINAAMRKWEYMVDKIQYAKINTKYRARRDV